MSETANDTTNKAINTSNGIKLFIGAKLSLESTNLLARAAQGLQQNATLTESSIRWGAPATYHLTLKFIGWTRTNAITAINDRVEAALQDTPQCEFETRGIGAFPNLEKAQVIWAGVHQNGDALTKLSSKIDSALTSLGYPSDKYPFYPHVTLGRLKLPSDVRDMVASLSEQAFSKTRIESVTLFKSTTKTNGSEYTNLMNWPLNSL